MRDYCKAIIDGAAEVSGVSGTSLPCNLNMVEIEGVEPTEDEVATIMRANEEYCRTIRAVVHGWIARLPAARDRRKKEKEDQK